MSEALNPGGAALRRKLQDDGAPEPSCQKQPLIMTPSTLPLRRCVALQGLRVAASRRLGWPFAVLLLTTLALLAQGIALAGDRASGPAHVHIGSGDHGSVESASSIEHERLHARGIAHHEHDPDDASVLAAADAGDDDAGASSAAKRLPLDHGVVASALLEQPARAIPHWAAAPASRFVSRTSSPLERPPR